jgi:hypothetical protein
MGAPDMGLNDEYQLVDDSRANAARDPDADLQSGSILTGGVVAPSLIQDELIRSQDPFDGVEDRLESQGRDLIPNSRLEVLPAGHAPWLGNPGRTAELVSGFVH